MIHRKMEAGGFRNLSDEDREHWHAYIYGSRRVWFNDRGTTSPVDPSGEWFNAQLADLAERFYQVGRYRYRRRA